MEDVLNILYIIVPTGLIAATPLLLTALGGLFSERAGIINIGLEGIMIMGAFSGIMATLGFEKLGFGNASIWMSFLVAIIVGAIFSLIHAFATISLRADQNVSGIALNFLAAGISIFIVKELFGKGQTDYITERLYRINVPLLSDIPVIGPLFFSKIYVTTYIALLVVVIVWFVLMKTTFGLRLRAVGEHPLAADTMGIKVIRMRYIGVMLSGALGGLGGAIFAITNAGNFASGTIVGQGFMALAVLVFGKWKPFGVMLAAMFFGLAQALSITAQQIPAFSNIPQIYLLILPYVLTIFALMGIVGKAEGPKAVGKPYFKSN